MNGFAEDLTEDQMKLFAEDLTEDQITSIKKAIDKVFKIHEDKIATLPCDHTCNLIFSYVGKRLKWSSSDMYRAYLYARVRSLHPEVHPEAEEEIDNVENVDVQELHVNIETASAEDYLSFGDRIKETIANPRISEQQDVVYVLPSHLNEAVKRDPFFPVKISTSSCYVTYIVYRVNLYILGWVTSKENKLHIFKHVQDKKAGPPNVSHKGKKVYADNEFENMKKMMKNMPIFQDLQLDVYEHDFKENYVSMQSCAGAHRRDIPIGKNALLSAIFTLCKKKAQEADRSRALIISVEMIAEFSRFRSVREFVRFYFLNGQCPESHLLDLQNSYEKLSDFLMNYVDYNASFNFTVGDTVYTSENLVPELLVAMERTQ